jgi:hypothetical protein
MHQHDNTANTQEIWTARMINSSWKLVRLCWDGHNFDVNGKDQKQADHDLRQRVMLRIRYLRRRRPPRHMIPVQYGTHTSCCLQDELSSQLAIHDNMLLTQAEVGKNSRSLCTHALPSRNRPLIHPPSHGMIPLARNDAKSHCHLESRGLQNNFATQPPLPSTHAGDS